MRRLTSVLGGNLASRKPITVACIDLPIEILAEIAANSNEHGVHVPKNPKYKDLIAILVTFLKKAAKASSNNFAILWCIRDEQWRWIQL